ncbi:MAG TPA: magnesium-translocating P-type ATPase [Candidatus Deferrimicrobium sp.]|nr:magnesium-translocating P-type ATPase [Candidatus Deferrimicrobium sp.]
MSSPIVPTEVTKRKREDVPAEMSKLLASFAAMDADAAMKQLGTSATGLTDRVVEDRLVQHGPNEIAREKRVSPLKRLIAILSNPLSILLIVLAIITAVTGGGPGVYLILLMVVLGAALRFFQEQRSDNAAAELQKMVTTTATVVRNGDAKEVALRDIVPGDMVSLSAGDMVPADVRLVTAKDLFVSQAALTGESLPAEKNVEVVDPSQTDVLSMPNLCFMGTNVETGSATAVVVQTGKETYFGSLASSIVGHREMTSFDKGINNFTWLMIKLMLVMAPTVFLINGLMRHNWMDAFLFGLAVAVGLTPEMLPMIVTVNMSKGAVNMSRKKVIVKRLNAIQNFGAMDVLCTDKTGTITQGRVELEKHVNLLGNEDSSILDMGFLNSYYQTGLKNLMDVAILAHLDKARELVEEAKYHKVDEIPFDFTRKRMSVAVTDGGGTDLLICKGAVEEVLSLSTSVALDDKVSPMDDTQRATALKLVADLNGQGFRVLALATSSSNHGASDRVYTVNDEHDLTLLGFLAFLDPPKPTAGEAIATLHSNSVDVKILTGDGDLVTVNICHQVGITEPCVLLGPAIEKMSDDDLAGVVEDTVVFARLSPHHKERIIRALQSRGHVVGFLGDGINDAPALRTADVGISVDSAVDIAKESSDIILLENSLLVLKDGVIEGRKVFGNVIKYIKMAASSNFGNMFSVVGASAFLPFLPMLPLQILTNNLLYDLSQTTIPTDTVDEEWLTKPRKWELGNLRRFIVIIGPISSVFDYMTFFIMLVVFKCWNNPALFHSGWFVESLFTQTLIVHVIRTNKIPFIQSLASKPLLISSVAVVATGALMTVIGPIARILGFVTLPPLYWLLLLGMLLIYVVLTQFVKTWFIHRFGDV